MVGTGAVASGLFYWLREIGLAGAWEVVDRDRVELHNTNRALTLVAADAGWPNGIPRQPGVMKASAAAELLGIEAYEGWYHEWLADNGDRRPDLVLPLANDFSVRHAIGQRGGNILLHATTSPNWTAELHRHVAGGMTASTADCPSGCG